MIQIPYPLLQAESGNAADLLEDLQQIHVFYKIYKNGVEFQTEGANGDYTPAELRYKMTTTLINKQARFLFGESPDIVVEYKGDDEATDDIKKSVSLLSNLIKTILQENRFDESLIKAAKDCFIGKRIACVVNFDEEYGITVTFVPSTHFIFTTDYANPKELKSFVYFQVINSPADSGNLAEKRIFKKKYTQENGIVYVEESIYDASGLIAETVLEKTATLLTEIPVSIFINDGLTGEIRGESEIALLAEYEEWYSKLSNADIDAGRKSMNPTRYTNDMEPNSTKGLKAGPGQFWDLSTNQNLDKAHPMVGMLEPSMNYSGALKTTLERVKTAAYEQVDMPNISLETMSGAITSGKSLKAIYWGLIVRCKEKMKVWEPQIRLLIEIIIDGSYKYPNCITRYVNETLTEVDYNVRVVPNNPLPEDDLEEMGVDLQNVESRTMSRKAYMQKWRGLTDEQVEDELMQIGREREILEDSAFVQSESSSFVQTEPPMPMQSGE